MFYTLLVTIGIIGVIAGLMYNFLVYNFDHWKKLNVKGPKPKPLYGNIPNVITQKRHIAYDYMDIYNQFKKDEDFVGFYNIRTPQLLILKPELGLKLLTSEFKHFSMNESSAWFNDQSDVIVSNNPFMLIGQKWKETRQQLTGGITTARIKNMYPIIERVSENLIRFITDQNTKVGNKGISAKDIGLRYSADVVTDCFLGLKAESFTENPTVFEKILKLFHNRLILVGYMGVVAFWPTIRYFYKIKYVPKKTENFFFDLMGSGYEVRRKQITSGSGSKKVFLDYMLELQEKKKISDWDLKCLSMTFLLGGYETSAATITTCLYLLAKTPDKQAILYEEIRQNCDENAEIDFEKLEHLPYLEQCIYEGMRMVPPQLTMSKICTSPCELTNRNGNKLKVNVGDVVQIPMFSFSHDEQYYPNHEKFIPERFSPENGGVKKYEDMGAFLPFGHGPRVCFGKRFALAESKKAVFEIVKKFNLKLNPHAKEDNLLDPLGFFASIDGNVLIDFEERK